MGNLDYLSYVIFLLPSILGIYRWCMWFSLKFVVAILYKPIPLSLEPKLVPLDMTIVVPIYCPEKSNFVRCLRSWILSGSNVILVADKTCYDEVLSWSLEEYISDNILREGQLQVVCENKPGKRLAMWNGLERVRTEVMCFVDDDSMWSSTVVLSLLSVYENDLVGGCGTLQRVRGKGKYRTVTEVMADMRLSMRYREVKATTYMGGYASCISGRTASYRTCVLRREGFRKFFLEDKFMGRLQSSGDDKCLTRWLFIQPDYKMYNQVCDECCVTTTFDDGLTFLKQTLRWARNTWRSDITTVFTYGDIMWKKGFWLCIILIDRFIAPFTMIGGLFLIIIGFIRYYDPYLLLYWVLWLLFSRGVKLFTHFLKNPWDVKYLPIFIFYTYLSAMIKIYALCTLENRSWGTRPVKVDKNNNIVRKGDNLINVEDKDVNNVVNSSNVVLMMEEGKV
jgi:cellulose synthase/poly-beta-1,6-N-acetylglucosamine synthase-like glycosyltransferase